MNVIIPTIVLFISSISLAQNPPFPLQLFYLSPNNVELSPSPKVAVEGSPRAKTIVSKTISQKKLSDGEEIGDEEESQSSQFHSQDTDGRAVFGYSTPNQVRIEARNVDGTVRGSYSYLDAWGQIVKVRYWDDGSGFHVVGNNLPGTVQLPDSIKDDPDVEAAKQHHLELFQQALHSSFFPENSDKPKKDENFIYESADDGVVVETDKSGDNENQFIRYPAVVAPPSLYDPSHVHDSDREAVIVDNPEIATFRQISSDSLRRGKNLQFINLPGTTNLRSKPSIPSNGFFYSFQHPAPLLVQVKTLQDGKSGVDTNSLSLSQKATLFGAIPVAAVHDTQVSPNQRNSIKNYQVLPVYVEPHHDDKH